VQTNIDSQQTKLSSPKKRSNKTHKTTLELLTKNAWWPFDRVDGRLLVKLHKQSINNLEESPL
jgi:hypothetical protein